MSVSDELSSWVLDARARTFALIRDLDEAQLFGPRLAIVNPLLWEIGHVAWFQERWFLRHVLGRAPMLPEADALWDSTAVAHDLRWDLPLPTRSETLDYLCRVRDAVLDTLARGELGPNDGYFVKLGVLHEDMHDEAFVYTRQTLGLPPPATPNGAHEAAGPLPGDAAVPAGELDLGARPDSGFVFDNEKWAHRRHVDAFSIARAPVTQGEYAEFVDAGGYLRDELWSDAGRAWRETARAEQPVYWRKRHGHWQRRHFDRWCELEPHRPMLFVCAHEADAYCVWAGRRLPTELEWEAAAAAEPSSSGLSSHKRSYPWGAIAPATDRARLDLGAAEPLDVAALPAGDSAFGCRQMIGNVWEWTSSAFEPYPGFVADPYAEYSAPWFHTHRVLRGGAFATRARLIRNTWRNFYTPDRRDVLAGFRTCAR